MPIKSPLNNKNIILISVLIILVFLIIILFISFHNHEELNNDIKEYDKIEIIDDRISPLTNQGLTIEIKRIRNRGLINEMLHKLITWRKTPEFYLEIKVNNKVLSNLRDFNYETWDSYLHEMRYIIDVEEELEKSEIIIRIMERTKYGLLKSNYLEKEVIILTYDYKNGRWDGDDFFKDRDGYGHYVGNLYEIWFNIYQFDYDHDGIPYWTELNIIKTDPYKDDSKLDPDEDGITTSWEWKWGYNPTNWDDHINLDPDIDGLSNFEEFLTEKWLSNPFQMDIFIEVDGMEKKHLFDPAHTLPEETKQIIIERFCTHGINVYFDDGWNNGPSNGGGELVPHNREITWNSGIIAHYYNQYFSDTRKGLFRYLLICHNAKPLAFSGNTEFNRYDTIVMGTSAYDKILPTNFKNKIMASVLLHELGHTLGIAPYTTEGCDNLSLFNIKELKDYIQKWGNYKSVMNYLYIINKNIVDFSDGTHGNNDQNDWESIYLPFFQIENNIVCDPFTKPPAKDKVVNENISIELQGWEFNKDLTEIYLKQISEYTHLGSFQINWSVLVKKNESTYPSDRNIRIYASPIVPISDWSLIKEGYYNSKEGFSFYNCQNDV